MNSGKHQSNRWILLALLIILGGLVLSRPLAIFFLLTLGLVGLVAGPYFLYDYVQKRKAEKQRADTVPGMIEARLDQCNEMIDVHSKELRTISDNIRDLESRLKQVFEINPITMQETEKLIEGFKKELALRETKIAFYNTCKRKLSTMLYNYNFTVELEKKKAKLSELQMKTYDSNADMERMKSDMQYDMTFVETLTRLSGRMMLSDDLDSAQALQLELVELTGDNGGK